MPPGTFEVQDVVALFKQDGVRESIFYIFAFLNHPHVFAWVKRNFSLKGNTIQPSPEIFRQIPFRAID
ncbi:MAG: hypothetical protein NZ534_00975 [Bacteroidia bacterium]|nr:hypothetical protein [Bacteroidia bacterium]